MSGPCPNGANTALLHKEARCQDRESCVGPGCRVRRAPRWKPAPNPITGEMEYPQ